MLPKERHQIATGPSEYDNGEGHYDFNSEKPRCEKILDLVYSKLHGREDLESKLDLLTKHIGQFNELHEAYVNVANKHKLDLVRTEKEWLADKEIEDLIDLNKAPIDLSAAIMNFGPVMLMRDLVLETRTTTSEVFKGKFKRFLSEVPDVFFVEARDLMNELDALDAERPDFENWLMEKAVTGVFRTEVMAEIDRRWSNRGSGRLIGKSALERLENQGHLVRSKKQGKLHFMQKM